MSGALSWLLLVSLLCTVFAVIGLLVADLLVDTWLGRLDVRTSLDLAEGRTPPMDRLADGFTTIGNTIPVICAASVLGMACFFAERRREGFLLIAAMATEITVFLVTAEATHRGRPEVVRLDATPGTGAFPSGHVAASVTLWLCWGALAAPHLRNRLLRAAAFLPAVLIGLGLAHARAYQGLHHPTDVVAGLLLGACAFGAGVVVTRVAMRVRAGTAEEALP